MIYAVVNTKGGVGKTTTAVHLATMLARTSSTLLIDGDPQESAASWSAWRREANREYKSPVTIRLKGKAIHTEGQRNAEPYEHTVIDAGGRDSVGMRAALLYANQAIVPVGASQLDAAAMTDLLEIVDLAREFNAALLVRVLLTRIDVRTRDVAGMVAFLEEQKLSILSGRVCERVAYRRAIGEGAIVQELGRDPAAIEEMETFLKAVTT